MHSSSYIFFNMWAENEFPPLFLLFQAARDGRLDIIKTKLLKSQKYINKKDENNMTALHYAVRFFHVDIVKYLIKKGAGMYFTFHTCIVIHSLFKLTNIVHGLLL